MMMMVTYLWLERQGEVCGYVLLFSTPWLVS